MAIGTRNIRSERSFWHALVNQVDGTRLAMREIRRANPKARLIQTDDLGRTTPPWRCASRRPSTISGVDGVGSAVRQGHLGSSVLEAADGVRVGGPARAIADDPCQHGHHRD
jgi:dTDP-4-dehydrorhamnose reductase